MTQVTNLQQSSKIEARPQHIDDRLADITQSFYFTLKNYQQVQRKARVFHLKLQLPVFINPDMMTEQEGTPEQLLEDAVSRFTEALSNELQVYETNPTGHQPMVRRVPVGFFWLRHQRSEMHIVYHVFVLTGNDAQYQAYDTIAQPGSMNRLIKRLWCEACYLDLFHFSWLATRSIQSYPTQSSQNEAKLISKFQGVLSQMNSSALIYPDPWLDGLVMMDSNQPMKPPVM